VSRHVDDVLHDERGWVGGGPLTRFASWLHRKGISRTLNSRSNNWNRNAQTCIETRGPRWLGERLWRFTSRHGSTFFVDLDTARVVKVEHVGRWTYRWTIAVQRIGS
jgi:hypothetical protein